MVRTYRSAVIHAPIESVWNEIRDFNALPHWHPSIARSEIEDGRASDSVGCVRSFYLQDGGFLREQIAGPLRLRTQLHLQHPRLADAGEELRRHFQAHPRSPWARAHSLSGGPTSTSPRGLRTKWSPRSATASSSSASRPSTRD